MSATPSPLVQVFRKTRLNSAFQHLMSLHWAMMYCYIILFLSGPVMARLPRELSVRGLLYDFHKGVGVLTVALLSWRILTLLRVWWKKHVKRTPKRTAAWWRKVALHGSLYVFMWAVPTTGFLLSNSFKSNNVRFMGIALPDIFPQNEQMVGLGKFLHFWLAYIFLAFVVLHAIDQRKVLRSAWRRLFPRKAVKA